MHLDVLLGSIRAVDLSITRVPHTAEHYQKIIM